MKRFSKLICAIMVFSMVLSLAPLSVFAGASYKEVDYSEILYANYDYLEDQIKYSDPEISENISENEYWNGRAQGYSAYLLEGKEYTLTVFVEGNNAAYIAYAAAILDYDIENSETLTDDILAVQTNSFLGDELTLTLTYTPETSGFYRILIWGICEDASENELTDSDTYIVVELASDIDYTDVDYSYKICPERKFTTFISESNPFIEGYIGNSTWYGFARGYSIYLVKNTQYDFTVRATCDAADYIDRAIAILDGDLCGTYKEDYLAGACDDTDSSPLELNLTFTPDTTGYYNILIWGYCEDSNYNQIMGSADTSISLFVSSPYMLDFKDVDYSEKISFIGEEKIGCIDLNDPKIYTDYDSYDGYAKGYSVELEAEKDYIIEYTVEAIQPNAVYSSAFVSLMYEDFETYVDPSIVRQVAFSDDNLTATVTLIVNVDTTGTYKILTAGSVSDNSENRFGEESSKTKLIVRNATYGDFDVYSASDLQNFRSAVENSGADIYNVNFYADIDMTDEEWKSVDAPNNKINLNGNYYTIKGLTTQLIDSVMILNAKDIAIDINTAFDDSNENFTFKSVLAGYCETAYLSNCHATGSINVNAKYVESVSGLIGDILYGSIEHCSSDVDINIKSVNDICYIGGLHTYSYDIDIMNSSYNGEITLESENFDIYCVGGLAGSIYNAYVENCSAEGILSIVDYIGGTFYYSCDGIGGLFGVIEESYIRNCCSDVDMTSLCGMRVGGFAGYSYDNFYTNCYAEGSVAGHTNVGGFVGSANEDRFFNCYATVDVSGDNCVGGFVGKITDVYEFQNCYALGEITCENICGRFIGGSSDNDVAPILNECFVNITDKTTPINCDIFVYDTSVGGYVPTAIYGIGEIDFSDIGAVNIVEDLFNDNVETLTNDSGILGLLEWTGRNALGGPVFVYESVTAPHKPCFHTFTTTPNKFDENKHWFQCENTSCPHLDETIFDDEVHDWVLLSDSASCDMDGVAIYECSGCSATKEEASYATGHKEFYWFTVTEPTTEEEGLAEYRCKECDACEEVKILPKIPTEYILGDVDNNGKIEADDYILLKRIFFGMAKLENQPSPETAFERADVDENGKIEADDYILLKRVFFGIAKLN